MNEILMYGPIGPDFWEPENAITAKSVMAQLSEISGDVTVRISSGGGDVFEGIDIMSALKNHDGKVTVIVESLAASAASFIAIGGADRVLMRPSSELMVHRAWSLVEGNADDVRKTLADLERQDNKLAAIYAGKAGGEVDDWLDAMSKETWYTAEEAVAAGLADAVVTEKSEAPTPSASLAKRRFKFANRAAAPPPPVTRSESRDDTTTPSDGQKGDTVSILNQLAQELGKTPEDVQNALSGFFNEQVAVSGQVDVTYPEETAVVPTESVTVEPTVSNPDDEGEGGDAGVLGISFAIGNAPEGWEVTVDESTGAVTAQAPSGVEPGDEFTVTVTVNESTEVPVVFKVRAMSEPAEETTAPADGDALADDVVTVPRAVWNEYLEDRARYSAKLAEDKRRELEAKVDGHIRDGRYSAGHRGAAIAAYQTDPVAAEKIWGSLPKNVAVPVQELGHSGDVDGMTKLEMLRSKAAANRQNKKENK